MWEGWWQYSISSPRLPAASLTQGISSESTLESKLLSQSTAQSRVAAGPAPDARAAALLHPGSPHLGARTWTPAAPAPRACALRPQGPRWACEARPCSGPMPPGCPLHSVGFGSLNGRCGACPEDIFQVFRTLETRTLSPSASQALALRRPAPGATVGCGPDGRPGCGLGVC